MLATISPTRPAAPEPPRRLGPMCDPPATVSAGERVRPTTDVGRQDVPQLTPPATWPRTVPRNGAPGGGRLALASLFGDFGPEFPTFHGPLGTPSADVRLCRFATCRSLASCSAPRQAPVSRPHHGRAIVVRLPRICGALIRLTPLRGVHFCGAASTPQDHYTDKE